jgi:hypothetical protein
MKYNLLSTYVHIIGPKRTLQTQFATRHTMLLDIMGRIEYCELIELVVDNNKHGHSR